VLPTSLLSNSTVTTAAGAVALLLVALIVLSTLGALVTFTIVVIANRADPDPTGKRPLSAYLFGGSFLTLWITFAAILALAFTLIGVLGSHPNDPSSHAINAYSDSVIRSLVLGTIVAGIAGYAYLIHRKRGIALAESDEDPSSPSRRVLRGYAAAVSLISTVLVILGSIAALYEVFQLIAPGVFMASGSRVDTVKSLLDELVVVLLAAGVFRSHQALVPAEQRLFAGLHQTPTAD